MLGCILVSFSLNSPFSVLNHHYLHVTYFSVLIKMEFTWLNTSSTIYELEKFPSEHSNQVAGAFWRGQWHWYHLTIHRRRSASNMACPRIEPVLPQIMEAELTYFSAPYRHLSFKMQTKKRCTTSDPASLNWEHGKRHSWKSEEWHQTH